MLLTENKTSLGEWIELSGCETSISQRRRVQYA